MSLGIEAQTNQPGGRAKEGSEWFLGPLVKTLKLAIFYFLKF
jgi:hypothetical protein